MPIRTHEAIPSPPHHRRSLCLPSLLTITTHAPSSPSRPTAKLLMALQKRSKVLNCGGLSLPGLYKLRRINESSIEGLADFLEELSLPAHKLDFLPKSFSTLSMLTVLRLDQNRLRWSAEDSPSFATPCSSTVKAMPTC